MSNGHQIFISYAQEDGDNAASLASELRDIGIMPYLAQRDLNVGDNWEPAIREALKESKVMLCMVTPTQ